MTVQTVPFTADHAAPAAALLARSAAGHEISGPAAATADPAAALHRVTAWSSTMSTASAPSTAFAAVGGGGRLLGFLAADTPAPGDRKARIRLDRHAAVPGEPGHRARCALYAALSARLAADGVTVHEVDVPAADEQALASFARLGFGLDQVRGFRLSAPGRLDARVRRARPDDVPELLELASEVAEFHAGPPMWQPSSPATRAAVERGYREALADGGRTRLLLTAQADPTGPLLGVFQAAPDAWFPSAVTIGLAGVTAAHRGAGLGTALLNAAANWSTARGFPHCGAEWTSANPVSDPFWRGRGLSPAMYRLSRVLAR